MVGFVDMGTTREFGLVRPRVSFGGTAAALLQVQHRYPTQAKRRLEWGTRAAPKAEAHLSNARCGAAAVRNAGPGQPAIRVQLVHQS